MPLETLYSMLPCSKVTQNNLGAHYAGKLEFKCKSRGMETCLHFRGAALNARETGIQFARSDAIARTIKINVAVIKL